MKVTFGSLVIAAGMCGLLSFAVLATSLATDYWYIIEMNPMNASDFEDISSHSGLWRIHEGTELCFLKVEILALSQGHFSLENPVVSLKMYFAIVVLLPLSLVLLLFGGICGLVSSLARSPVLLTGLLTLCGASLYIIYSQQALAETERLVGQEGLAYVRTAFGWSLGLAWVSYGLELLAGVLLLIAAQMVKLQHSSPTMA
uniref:Transmembrane protein 235-like n=1 Tax=Stegastes partitus TaxID=144197 RepID=A0A3B5A9N3_9TELE